MSPMRATDPQPCEAGTEGGNPECGREWLKDMGLELKPSKTRITHTLDPVDGQVGFDFLGFHFRQYRRGKNRCIRSTRGVPVGFTTTVKASAESQRRFLVRIREISRSNRTISQEALVGLLNPVIRGWGNYFSRVVSQKVFVKMDGIIFRRLWAWALRRHSNKGRRWVYRKYWHRGDHGWGFGPAGNTALAKMARIPIRRHVKVQGQRSPFDGDAIYWSTRVGRHPGLPTRVARLLQLQRGRCARCGLYFKLGDLFAITREGAQADRPGLKVLLHQHCQGNAWPVAWNDKPPYC